MKKLQFVFLIVLLSVSSIFAQSGRNKQSSKTKPSSQTKDPVSDTSPPPILDSNAETEKGIELYQNGDCKEAISVLEKVVKADEENRKAWFYLGVCLGKKRGVNEAVEAFQRWRSIKPSAKNSPKDNSVNGFKILLQPIVRSTEESRRKGISGKVILVVEFMANGKVGFIFPLQTLLGGLTEKSIDAAKAIKFEPGWKDGKPVPVVKFIEYSFLLV